MKSLNNKVALITGGTRGIGKAIAMKLAENGTQLALNYFRNKKAAQQSAEEIESQFGIQPLLLKGNVGDSTKVEQICQQALEHFGGIDILISNAASGVLKPVEELTTKHLTWSMEINAYALLYLTQQILPSMIKRGGGKIIAVSSLGAVRAYPYYTAVGSSKGALESIIRHMSIELANKNINVNTLSAGVIDTEALKHFPNREDLIKDAIERSPIGRLVQPEDVANVALFLCSDLSNMIQGQTIMVDGGYSVMG